MRSEPNRISGKSAYRKWSNRITEAVPGFALRPARSWCVSENLRHVFAGKKAQPGILSGTELTPEIAQKLTEAGVHPRVNRKILKNHAFVGGVREGAIYCWKKETGGPEWLLQSPLLVKGTIAEVPGRPAINEMSGLDHSEPFIIRRTDNVTGSVKFVMEDKVLGTIEHGTRAACFTEANAQTSVDRLKSEFPEIVWESIRESEIPPVTYTWQAEGLSAC